MNSNISFLGLQPLTISPEFILVGLGIGLTTGILGIITGLIYLQIPSVKRLVKTRLFTCPVTKEELKAEKGLNLDKLIDAHIANHLRGKDQPLAQTAQELLSNTIRRSP
jgi:hypothetical protein